MKKTLLAFAVVSGLFCLSATAAETTQITVQANIVASACTIDTDALTINLHEIEAASLLNAGSASPWSAAQGITLSACPASTTSVNATFTGTQDTDDTNGFKNTGTATNVSVELAKPDGTIFQNGNPYGDVAVNAGKVTFPVVARVFSKKGGAMPGSVIGVIQVNFSYK